MQVSGCSQPHLMSTDEAIMRADCAAIQRDPAHRINDIDFIVYISILHYKPYRICFDDRLIVRGV